MEPGLLQLQRDDRYPKRLGGHNKIVRQSEFQRLTTGAKIEIRTTMVDRIKIVLTKLEARSHSSAEPRQRTWNEV
jgi:hypothetical protein